MSNNRPLESLPPTETLEIENGLSLAPRVKLLLTIFRADPSSVKPIDDWQLKRSLIDFFRNSFASPISVLDDDLTVRRFKDLKKRKRDDPVASGTLCIRDLGFLSSRGNAQGVDGARVLEKKLLDWRKSLVDKMEGMGLNIEGVKYRLSVAVPVSDDFDAMRKEWEELSAFGGGRGSARGGRQQPDTIILRGAPSRWFAEPRVSSKPSMLVTHTIFSTFGRIRNLSVAEDDDLGKTEDDDSAVVGSGLQCKIVVQFEKYQDFYNALKVLCGRSLQKEGSRLKADYEVTWDRVGFFPGARNHTQEKNTWTLVSRRYESEASRRKPQDSHVSYGSMRTKRFKE